MKVIGPMNIKLIKELLDQAILEEDIVMNSCYNMPGDPSVIMAGEFIFFIKSAKQAQVLFDNLTDLYKECSDFILGNFQPYIDEHKKWVDDESLVYNPFSELHYHFHSGLHTSLPEIIEQYRELLAFTRKFADLRRRLDEGFDVLVSDISPDEGTLAEREINSINIEYCLDGYNNFYQQCRALIEIHRREGTIKACSESILMLFT